MTYIGDYEGPALKGVDWQGGVGNWGIAQYGDDRRAIVFFHKHSVFNEIKSTQAGRRVYDEVDFVSIQHPGEREQKIDRPVQEADKHRWPNQWMAFQKNQQQVVDGTPVDLLFPQHPAVADNFRSIGITTIEQLANLSATGMANVGMGAQEYVNYAKQYLDMAQKGVGFHELKKELSDRDQKIKLQGQQIEALKAQIDAIMAAQTAGMPAPAPFRPAPAPQQPGGFDSGLPPLPSPAAVTSEQKRKPGRPPRKPLVSFDQSGATDAAD